jgi:hypothetical protein
MGCSDSGILLSAVSIPVFPMNPSDPQPASEATSRPEQPSSGERLGKHESRRGAPATHLLPVLILAGGFAARLYEAAAYFLNPDEALHVLLASQRSMRLAYAAALTNAHPPLLILLLYYWRWLGRSELILRLPSVLAGTASCWVAYLWLKQVTERKAALIGLLLLSFSPAFLRLSAEVRQYGLLLFFISACLYFSECALRQNSHACMLLFSLSLYGALLVHYSALLFAFTIGVYMLVRLHPYGKHLPLVINWGTGQIVALGVSGYFVFTHLLPLRKAGMLAPDYDTYLRKSIFHSHERSIAGFAAVQTLRVFTYLFSHGVVGALALLAFVAGIAFLLRGKSAAHGAHPRALALLVVLALAANCGAALAGQYPYGATRHSAWLLPFAVATICGGLARWARSRFAVTSLIVICALVLCNLFPSPPPLIRPRNQARALMKQAVDSFRQSAANGSVIVADYQSALLFGYYVCEHGVVQVFGPPHEFTTADCGPYRVITTSSRQWRFNGGEFPSALAGIVRTYQLGPRTSIWAFDAGWIADSAPELQAQLRHFGCSAPRRFGENIFLCLITVDAAVAGAQRQ